MLLCDAKHEVYDNRMYIEIKMTEVKIDMEGFCLTGHHRTVEQVVQIVFRAACTNVVSRAHWQMTTPNCCVTICHCSVGK